MFFIRIGNYVGDEKKQAERDLVTASGGKVYQDSAWQQFAVFETRPPIPMAQRLQELSALPNTWKEVVTP